MGGVSSPTIGTLFDELNPKLLLVLEKPKVSDAHWLSELKRG